jgi:predicted transposase/invertase (TIGR01784 family)
VRKFGSNRLNKEYNFDDELKYAKEEARKEGWEEGMKKGKKKSSIEMAQTMLKYNYPLTMISEIVDLPIDEIERLNRKTST